MNIYIFLNNSFCRSRSRSRSRRKSPLKEILQNRPIKPTHLCVVGILAYNNISKIYRLTLHCQTFKEYPQNHDVRCCKMCNLLMIKNTLKGATEIISLLQLTISFIIIAQACRLVYLSILLVWFCFRHSYNNKYVVEFRYLYSRKIPPT